jgi:ribosomal protein S18 acetylase RimI-like enzyme
MQEQPTIVHATAGQGELLADILGDAFLNDPAMNWVIPLTDLYPAFFKLLADKLYLEQELVFLDSESRGAAMWLPPGVDHKVPNTLAQLLLVVKLVLHSGLGVLPHLQQAQEVMGRNHPREPHYYLHAIGARRSCQGQGIGSALLKAGTRICDEAGMPAYLESSSPKNIPLYERHGFEVTSEEPVGRGGPPLYFMWREAR